MSEWMHEIKSSAGKTWSGGIRVSTYVGNVTHAVVRNLAFEMEFMPHSLALTDAIKVGLGS